MVRAPFYDKNGLKKGLWSEEEDDKLIAFIQKYGAHLNWRQLPKLAGLSRCGKSCRLRWVNYLRPGVKRGSYTKEEEDLIIELHKEVGNKWSMIAAKLAGRTDNEIKNHWHTNLKKRAEKNPPSKVKEQSGESFGRINSNQNRESEAENSSVSTAPCHQILESSPLSVEESSGKFSSSSSDHAPVSAINWTADADSLHSWETYEGLYSDFWTEPFVADNTSYIQNEYPILSMEADGGFISPCVLYYGDGIDSFELPTDMQEMPQN